MAKLKDMMEKIYERQHKKIQTLAERKAKMLAKHAEQLAKAQAKQDELDRDPDFVAARAYLAAETRREALTRPTQGAWHSHSQQQRTA